MFSYHYSLEGYHYAGLKAAAEALADVRNPDADSLIRNAAEFREQILRAYKWTQSHMPVVPLRDGTWIPGYPAQVYTPGPTNDYFPGQDANRSWAYDVELGAHQLVPQGVLDPSSREVERMMDHNGRHPVPAGGVARLPGGEVGGGLVQPRRVRQDAALLPQLRQFGGWFEFNVGILLPRFVTIFYQAELPV